MDAGWLCVLRVALAVSSDAAAGTVRGSLWDGSGINDAAVATCARLPTDVQRLRGTSEMEPVCAAAGLPFAPSATVALDAHANGKMPVVWYPRPFAAVAATASSASSSSSAPSSLSTSKEAPSGGGLLDKLWCHGFVGSIAFALLLRTCDSIAVSEDFWMLFVVALFSRLLL